MRNIHIEDSYKIWNTDDMWYAIDDYCKANGINDAELYLNRTHTSMYIEWYLHNIGYYLTKPFRNLNDWFCMVNFRCKDVDLEEHKDKGGNAK